MLRRYIGRYNQKSGLSLKLIFVYISGFLSLVNATDSSFAVRPCVRSWDAAKGFCRPLSECPDFGFDGTLKTRKPDLCEPYGRIPIVCCVAKEPVPIDDAVQALSLVSSIRESTLPTEAISRQKCREYAKLVSAESSTLIEDILGDSEECVQSRTRFGGAWIGEFPHMAAIGYEPNESEVSFFCGGTLVSERYVLTTAHCVQGTAKFGIAKWVLLGSLSTNLDKNDPQRQMIRVSQIIPHPDYKPPKYYFDVGLLQLASNARLGPFLRPACLPSDRVTSILELTIAGWGSSDSGGKQNKQLLKATLLEVPFDICQQSYSGSQQALPLGIHNASMFCAALPGSSTDACRGDSGGPLTAISPDFTCMYELVGVIDFGVGCGRASYPGVYARVAFYRKWIEDIVWS